MDIKVPDLNARAFDGKATYTVAASGQRAESLRLDAADMEIVAVKGNDGKPLEWSHDDGVLQVRLREAIGPRVADQAATPLQFSIEYRVREPRQGMKFSSAIPGVDGQAGMAAEIHTQGEPQSNHYWFPVHDFPNIRLATEMIVDVPAGVSVSGNGRLVEHRTEGGAKYGTGCRKNLMCHILFLSSPGIFSAQNCRRQSAECRCRCGLGQVMRD